LPVPSLTDGLALQPIKESLDESAGTRDLLEAPCVYLGMNENEIELRERLRELGQRPIDADAQELHLRRIEAVGVSGEPRRRGFVWAGVAAAALVGFMAGSTGLAMAGALPGRAQDVAHDVLGAVQVDVPSGKEGKRGPCVSEAAKIKDEDAKKAAIAACPKGGADDTGGGDGPEGSPGKSGDAPGKSGDAPGQIKHEGDPCHGRPPWAGKMSKEEREAAKQAASREACPPDADDDSALDADEESDADDDADETSGQPEPVSQDLTTTTIAEAPTTTVAEATTTTTTTTTTTPSG
jgi:hypothetical protein